VNTTQVDFIATFIYNSFTGLQTYKYAYFVRNNIFGDDLNDAFKNITDPCSSNPCLNGASCSIGYGNNYVCFCPISYTGIITESILIWIFYRKLFSEGFRCELQSGFNLQVTKALDNSPESSLCYPNPCSNGGMCVVSPDKSSFTCFCSSLYKGKTCQDLKETSVFNTGKSFSNYESMIRVNEDQQEIT
jgi:hypothetical protein